ncbi:MAG: polysaccharide biosynthesis C-terminal domain-containing protein [Polaromonas sp.]|nr:polysaccharide biosynthesis C-terminal domain-containing protein [Polaromonas sp.]
MVTVLFVVAAQLLAPFALRVFLEPGPVLDHAASIVRTLAWSVVLLGWSTVLLSAMRASGAAWVPALLSMAAIVGVEMPLAAVLEARFGLAGVFWACPATFLSMLVLHGLYYRHKEIKDERFFQPVHAIGEADGRAPGA